MLFFFFFFFKPILCLRQSRMSVSPLQGEVLVNTGIKTPYNCTISLGGGLCFIF